MQDSPIWQMEFGDGPLVACAVHDGHFVRADVAACLKLSDSQRLYEEDPHTAKWTSIAQTRIIARRSRFELDLNRPRDKAVYIAPADAWGLDVWNCTPPTAIVNHSLHVYDEFYAHLKLLLQRLVSLHGEVVVFDLHSYNHVRDGAGSQSAEADGNPEINLGTGTMARALWAPIVDRWLHAMREYDFLGRRLDVRENVKFVGGQLPRWIHDNFANSVCVLAIEVKKFFMDEWTAELNVNQHRAIGDALEHAAVAVSAELQKVKSGPSVA
jgi:N-formylglutamate amidohydrolase